MNKNIKCAADLRRMYLEFFKSKGHAVIPSASVIPENDPTVLFTTAGMHPLVPYLLGAKHPMGTRLTDVQKCIRTGDIDEVGDASHCTFFEMLGNWSLGDYFKKEAISWSWEFLTSPEWLGLDPDKLAFTVFAGDDKAPRDDEAAGYWKANGVKDDHIFYLNAKHNWWGPAGITGPCGPDTEMFVIKDQPPCGPNCSPACDCGRYLEIWNDVFMQYNKQADGSVPPLEKKNVDTGMGLERTIGVLLGAKSVYETDLFSGIIARIEELSGKKYNPDDEYARSFRVVADHLRTSTIIIGDDRGVTPSNVDQGYVLRRLIRRSVRHGMKLEMPEGMTAEIAKVVVEQYKDVYPELKRNEAHIIEQLLLEEERFQKTLKQGMKEFDKLLFNVNRMSGLVKPVVESIEKGEDFAPAADAAAKALPPRPEYQALIALLKDKGDKAALRHVLGDEVAQKGSNITAERLRFDFSFHRKMTPEEIQETERLVNEYIKGAAPIVCEEMTVAEARAQGAIGLFESKYGERVKVYTMGEYSKEICGGPHASNTADLKSFKILKEESSSAGVRRIKAVIGK